MLKVQEYLVIIQDLPHLSTIDNDRQSVNQTLAQIHYYNVIYTGEL
jgi:hypothetical protein